MSDEIIPDVIPEEKKTDESPETCDDYDEEDDYSMSR